MEQTCFCCLAETTVTFKTSTRWEFRADECYDTNQSVGMMQLGELYSQLTQLPPPSEKLLDNIGEICSRCVGMLKDFYRFRTRAIKAYEELQTKANIAKIINSLEHSSIGSVEPEQMEDDLEKNNLNDEFEQFQNTSDTAVSDLLTLYSHRRMFKDRKLLTTHDKKHSNNKKYKCKQCEIEFTTKTSCFNHQLRIHDLFWRCNKDQTLAMNNKNAQYDKPSRTKALHQTNNIKAEPEQLKRRPGVCCDICLKNFTRTSSLNHHKQVLHSGIRHHVCHICKRTFGKRDSLNTHMALHVGKQYRCKLCSKSFARSSCLRKHLEEHEFPDSKRKHTCVVCSKSFSTASHLKDHELIHDHKKPHKCNQCEKSFRQKQQLKVHTYQHFGKPFQCNYCDMTYTSPSRLQTHVSKHHPGREQIAMKKIGIASVGEASTVSLPDFGDKVVNEEILNEICYQINSNPILLESIDAGGVNLICNEHIIFLNK